MTAAVLVEPEAVQVLIARILAELPAIGKNQKNTQQGYMFRGIDDVLDALKPLLGTHGVFIVPEVLERVTEQRSTKSNGVSYVVHLRVRFRLYGPRGDYVEGTTWGEGSDSGDKATSKAHTMAFKYFLFELFAISTAEQADADNDRHTAPETVRVAPPISSKTQEAFTIAAAARDLALPALVLTVTDGRTSLLAEVRQGDEQHELKTLIERHPKIASQEQVNSPAEVDTTGGGPTEESSERPPAPGIERSYALREEPF